MKLRQAGFEEENYKSLSSLAEDINAWCHENSVLPKNGQAAERLTVRNLRFYRAQGLLDPPLPGREYGRRHFLQMTVLRALQAQGLPLGRIRQLMISKSDAELHELLRRAREEATEEVSMLGSLRPLETWEVIGLVPGCALLCNPRRKPDQLQIEGLRRVLEGDVDPF